MVGAGVELLNMKEAAQKKLVEMFAKSNHLDPLAVPPNTQKVIAETAAPLYLFVECLGINDTASSPNPIDGILITWINRNYQVVSGMLSLLALHKFQQAEILSRTVMESSLTLLYLAQENTATRLVQYLSNYVEKERGQNSKWEKELINTSEAMRQDHSARILAKNQAMDDYELFIRHFSKEVSVSYPTDKGRQKFLDICDALGKAIDYRTVYMAMCSQAHHDAEDILNDLMVGSTNSEELMRKSELEKTNFSLNLILCSIRYYLESMKQVGKYFRFDSVMQQSEKSYAEITKIAESVIAGSHVVTPVDGWLEVTWMQNTTKH